MSSKKNVKKNTVATPAVTLAVIVASGVNGMFAPLAEAMEMAKAGDIEINEGVKDEAGNVAVRATAQGIAKAQASEGNGLPVAPAEQPKSEVPAFAIEAGIAIPAPEGRGRSGSKYPFNALEIGQSFFVPDSAFPVGEKGEAPDAAASLASTVSGATQRFAVDHPTEKKTVRGKEVPKKVYSRKFCLRKIAAGAPGCGPKGEAGARIWRIEVSGQPE